MKRHMDINLVVSGFMKDMEKALPEDLKYSIICWKQLYDMVL